MFLKALRPYLPNTGAGLAIVAQGTHLARIPYMSARFTQIIGGKTWSLSLITSQKVIQPEPQGTWVPDLKSPLS